MQKLRELAYKALPVLVILVGFSCIRNPQSSTQTRWQNLGFQDKFALRLRLYEPYLYVCAGSKGLWRRNIQRQNSQWEYLGLAETTVGDYFNRGVLDVIVDLDNPDKVLVAFAPDDATDHSVYKSTNGGFTWVASDSGMEFSLGSEIYYSRPDIFAQYPSRIVSAGTAIFSSDNFGAFWMKVGAVRGPVVAQATYALRYHTRKTNRIWLGGESVYFGPILMSSMDSGNSWEYVVLDRIVPVDNAVYSIAFDPEDCNILYLGMQGAIIKTLDGGQTWSAPLVTHPSGGWFRGLAADPSRSGHLFAAGGKTIIETHDAGQTWEEKKSPNRIQVLSMLYDYENESLYIGTETGILVYMQ